MKQRNGEKVKKTTPAAITFTMDTSTLEAANSSKGGKETEESKEYTNQCHTAAADAFERILSRTNTARDKSVMRFGNELAARLAWTLKDVKPSSELKSLNSSKEKDKKEDKDSFTKEFPLVSSCLKFELETSNSSMDSESKSKHEPSDLLSNRVLNEAYINDICKNEDMQYGRALEFYISSILDHCKKADNKPNDKLRQKLAGNAASALRQQLAVLPSLPSKALELTSALCDIDDITKKAAEASRKASDKNISQAANAHGELHISSDVKVRIVFISISNEYFTMFQM